MWPWEHLALGYLCYSGIRRLAYGDRPRTADAVVLAFGTQFPDLIDKPLAWTFAVLPNGLSLAHSLLFAVPVSLGAVAGARRAGRSDLGVAFAIGYLSHLAGDVLYSALAGSGLGYGFLLWPLVERPAIESTTFLTELSSLVASFETFLSTPRGQLYLAGEVVFLSVVVRLWVRDRYPPFGRLGATGGGRTGGSGERE